MTLLYTMLYLIASPVAIMANKILMKDKGFGYPVMVSAMGQVSTPRSRRSPHISPVSPPYLAAQPRSGVRVLASQLALEGARTRLCSAVFGRVGWTRSPSHSRGATNALHSTVSPP